MRNERRGSFSKRRVTRQCGNGEGDFRFLFGGSLWGFYRVIGFTVHLNTKKKFYLTKKNFAP